MDKLIKKLVEEFENEKNRFKKESEKINKKAKIVAKVNENGNVEILEVSGSKSALLATICIILEEMEKYSEDSAEHMAEVILTSLKMKKEIEEKIND